MTEMQEAYAKADIARLEAEIERLRTALGQLVYCYRGRWFSRVHTEHDITDIVGNLGLNEKKP